jgi:hypothetical protein
MRSDVFQRLVERGVSMELALRIASVVGPETTIEIGVLSGKVIDCPDCGTQHPADQEILRFEPLPGLPEEKGT